MKPNESPAEGASAAASPFPPAFRWEAAASEAPTQVMAGDLFQPVGASRDEPISKPTGDSAPPWADSEPPPIAEQQSAWLRRGPDVFATPAMRSGSKQIIGIAVLSVVVLGLVIATVVYFLTTGPGRTGSEQLAAPQPTAAPRDLPAPRPAPVDTSHALIDPPGQIRGGGGLFDLPQLTESTTLLPRPVLNALQTGGMTDGVLKTTTTGGSTIGMFAFTMPDQQAAAAVVRTIVAVQHDGGLQYDAHRALPGVVVLGSAPGSPSLAYRVTYVLYNRAIYFEVFGPKRDAVLATIDSLISQQVTYAPPTVRVGY